MNILLKNEKKTTRQAVTFFFISISSVEKWRLRQEFRGLDFIYRIWTDDLSLFLGAFN